MILDHLAIAAESLDEGTAWAEARLGLPLAPGGTHHGYGTHNRLIAAGDIYIEVIAPDPAQEPPRWFTPFQGPPRLAHWLCRTERITSPHPIHDLARGPLTWRITVPKGGHLPQGGAEPSLLEWTKGHPLDSLPETPLRLTALHVSCPTPLSPITDPRLHITQGPPKLSAQVLTPNGVATL